eukprot:267127-Rhodomonas_salina.1
MDLFSFPLPTSSHTLDRHSRRDRTATKSWSSPAQQQSNQDQRSFLRQMGGRGFYHIHVPLNSGRAGFELGAPPGQPEFSQATLS